MIVVSAEVLYNNRTYLANSAVLLYNKMTVEIDRIVQKAQGPQGFVYKLVATRSGLYPNLNTGVPTLLNTGDVWKYAQTINGYGRYSQSDLASRGLPMINIFHGNPNSRENYYLWILFYEWKSSCGNPIFR